jgi:succinate dehydrogenase (ubiquinone) iron-sulfur subunit
MAAVRTVSVWLLSQSSRPLLPSTARFATPSLSTCRRTYASEGNEDKVASESRIKKFQIHRWDPEKPSEKPRLQTYKINLANTGPMNE